VCEELDSLTDLQSSLETSASFGGSTSLFYLVDADQDLGYLNVADKALGRASSPDSAALRAKIRSLSVGMVALRQRLGVAFDAVQTTEVAAETAMDAAAMCHGVDLRDPSGSKRKASDPASAKSGSAGEAMAASKACEAPLRLWTAVRAVDLTSEVTSASVASHITELTLPAGTAAVRTRRR
jgi:hypothetical protein